MLRRTLSIALSATLIAGASAALAAPAAGAVSFTPCTQEAGFSCANVAVPLDRSGSTPGTISLSVERRLAGSAQSQSAVIALAGGPGQAALPLAGQFARAIAPALATRDLIAFDQRGTGKSDPLNCPVFNDIGALEAATESTFGALVERCALQIGPARGAFTTSESVEDIEAIRQAAGYTKLVLYGTSYGTKVALEYAERYPQHVEALVLDSAVPTSGPEPIDVSTFQAIGPALRALLKPGLRRNHIQSALRPRPPDRQTSQARARRIGLRRRRTPALGVARRARPAGNPGGGRPESRAAGAAAGRHAIRSEPRPRPLVAPEPARPGLHPERTHQTPERGSRTDGKGRRKQSPCTPPRCARRRGFPGSAAPLPTTRYQEALTALRAIPSSVFYPFDADTALHVGPILECDSWPDASPAPPSPGPLPNVPTLILSGAQDLRTPTSIGPEHRRPDTRWAAPRWSPTPALRGWAAT